MKHETPKTGRPGETSQWPRWEGPAENRPSGYMQGETNIFAEDADQQKHRGEAPAGYDRPDEHVETAVNEALTQDPTLDPTNIAVTVRNGRVLLEGTVASEADRQRAEECVSGVHGVSGCENN
ncbi:MAG TPA: BON domain-containing protein, partial [Pseudorhizobium sp.]|nr:BON domain-containing protein [Pseudorhizobium sp.]